MEINLDYDPIMLTGRPTSGISIGDQHHFPTPYTRLGYVSASAWFSDYSRILYLMYTATLIVMYAPLIAFIQIKFQNEKHSPFDTHGCFMIISVVALSIATFTSGILFYLNDPLQKSIMKRLSNINYTILKSVFSFSGILAPLSLIVVLFIPRNLNWVGFSIIFILLGAVITYHFYDYAKILDKKDERQRDVELAHQFIKRVV